MSDILVYAEQANGKIKKTAFEDLGKASELAQTLGGQVIAVVLGEGLDGAETDLAAYGAKKVVLAEASGLKDYNTIERVLNIGCNEFYID